MRKGEYRETVGEITEVKNTGLHIPTVLTVVYTVDGQDYLIRESVKLKSEFIKIWKIPIGQRKSPKLPSISIGTKLRVFYDVNNPQKAYLPDNEGIMTG